jgi:outer membrane protein assembly factor BamB
MWQWRPVGKTVDGNNGYSWSVTIPDLPGSANPTIRAILDDRIIGDSGMQMLGGRYATTDPWTLWAISLKPETRGQLLWLKDYPAPEGNVTMQIRYMDECASLEDGVLLVSNKEKLTLNAYNIDTGNWMWETESMNAYAMYGVNTQFENGIIYAAARYAGIIYAFDAQTGQTLWTWESGSPGFEAVWTDWPITGGFTVADEKIYVTTSEHSVTMPLYRGWKTFCVDANTGEGLWNITSISYKPAIADGYLVSLNIMDHHLYSNGKGPTKITVAGPDDVQSLGKSVLLKGMVTDQSPGTQEFSARFPNGVPAIADEYMSEWMEFLYKQHPRPMMINGVEVTLETLDPNGNYYEIGTVTSDASGMYKLMWEPPVPGEYTIIATFKGSESYFSSYAETAIGVEEAPTAGGSIEPEPTEAPLITTEISIIAVVAVAVIIGIIAFWALQKRK